MAEDKTLANELTAGMVVTLCPKTLLGLGGKPSGPPDRWVTGDHFFICIEADIKRCRMLPLYSNDGPGRNALSEAGRSGHEKWTSGAFHFHPIQTWVASRASISRAAGAAGDLTRSGARNMLDPRLLPKWEADQ